MVSTNTENKHISTINGETNVAHQYVLPEISKSDLVDYKQIGHGTYGAVYKVLWKSRNQIVAVKKMFLLEKEACVLAMIRHKNIIQFFGVVATHLDFAIVTEYAENGSLYHYLHDQENADLDFRHILKWALDIARGVYYLHYDAPKKILHLDMKSKNVVISADNLCKLCDFGASRPVKGDTVHMTVVGTVPWMSPEMISQKEKITEATDVWSYAVVLWELLTREIPFDGLNEFRIQTCIVDEDVRLTIPKGCPALLSDLIGQCWQTSAVQRPNFAEIVRRLDDMSHNVSLSVDADRFLREKQLWRSEIASQVSQLKDKENELRIKEAQLREKERHLKQKELRMNSNTGSIPQLQRVSSTDVNEWDEDGVVAWFCNLQFGISPQDKEHVKQFIYHHYITGRRLLMLTEWDLWHLGMTSIGHVRELMKEINQLAFENMRLRNFPSLNESQRELQQETYQKHAAEVKIPLQLKVIYYSGAARAAYSDVRRWKLVLDCDWGPVDDEHLRSQLPQDLQEQPAASLIHYVTFLPAKHEPIKVTAKDGGPFAFPRYLESFAYDDGNAKEVQAVVNYSDRVVRPRNTRFSLRISDFNSEAEVALIKLVELSLRPFATKKQKHANSPSSVSSAAAINHSESSPQLFSAWKKNRRYPDAIESPPTFTPTTQSKSTLWSEMASNLRAPSPQLSKWSSCSRTTGDYRKMSVPTPSPIAYGHADRRATIASLAQRGRDLGTKLRRKISNSGASGRRGGRGSSAGAIKRQIGRPNGIELSTDGRSTAPVMFSLSEPADNAMEQEAGVCHRSDSDVTTYGRKAMDSKLDLDISDSASSVSDPSRFLKGQSSSEQTNSGANLSPVDEKIGPPSGDDYIDNDIDETEDLTAPSQLSRKVHGGYGKWVWKK